MFSSFFPRTEFRRTLLVLGLAAVSRFSAPAAIAADTYPSREVTFVVPYPPGGNSDDLARLLADRLRVTLGVPIVIENRPGGTTSLGEWVAQDDWLAPEYTQPHSQFYQQCLLYCCPQERFPWSALCGAPARKHLSTIIWCGA